MSTLEYTPKKYICNICNIIYASRQSLWNHNHKFHRNMKVENVNQGQSKVSQVNSHGQPKVSQVNSHGQPKVIPNIIKCSNCEAIFKHKQSKWKHERNCKSTELLLLKEKFVNYEKERKEMEELFIEQINNVKKETLELLNKTCKIHPKTLNKINKQLNINNTLNDNKVINNNIIIQLGKENLSNVFTKNEQIKVLEKGYQSLAYLVQYTHFNHKYQYEIKNHRFLFHILRLPNKNL
jgi:hypothetical protein